MATPGKGGGAAGAPAQRESRSGTKGDGGGSRAASAGSEREGGSARGEQTRKRLDLLEEQMSGLRATSDDMRGDMRRLMDLFIEMRGAVSGAATAAAAVDAADAGDDDVAVAAAGAAETAAETSPVRTPAVAARAVSTSGLRSTACSALVAAAALVLLLTARCATAERHVAAGGTHFCVIQGGAAVCYGNSTTTSNKLNVPAGVAYFAVTVGDDFSCGLVVNGSMICWGALPGDAPPPASTFFIDAHAGPRHVCGLQPNGIVRCYGDGSRGATSVPSDVAFQGVTAGVDFTCGVARNHSVVCWGDDSNPVVSGGQWRAIRDAEHVACGADHACYVRVNGSVACWGGNGAGQATPPTALVTTGSVWWLAAGNRTTCAMSGAMVPGAVVCWGAITWTPTTAFEVACAAWGCVAFSPGSGGSSGHGMATLLPAAGGLPLPQVPGVAVVGSVMTLAGNGATGCVDGVGTIARFNSPRGISLAPDGSLYVADTENSVIRRVVLQTATVTTVAGICTTPGTIVGATPLQSTFNRPHGVDADAAGNVYVADTSNHRIRLLSGALVAGTGSQGSANGVGGAASFSHPYSLRSDAAAGKVYVTDTENGGLRIIAANNYSVSTLANFGGIVRGLMINTAGGFMYAGGDSSVKKITYAGVVTPLNDNTGNSVVFSWAPGIVADATGNLYVSDHYNHRIRKVTPDGNVTTVAGSTTAGYTDATGTSARFNRPWGLALSGGSLYVAEYSNHVIRLVSVGSPSEVWAASAPLPPSPLAAGDQLTAWRAMAASAGGANVSALRVDARSIIFVAPLAAVNTAALNPAIRTLLLGTVTLASRTPNAAAAADSWGNSTFSASAQRGLRSLTLTTAAIPADSLTMPQLDSLTLSAPSPAGSLALAARSFSGLPALACINCGAAPGLASLSGLGLGTSLGGSLAVLPNTALFAIPGITALDLSGNALTEVNEHDFDGAVYLRSLSLARNNISYVDDAAFSFTKHPALASIDQSGNPLLVAGGGCRAGYYSNSRSLCFGVYVICTPCTAGRYCNGSVTSTPCPASAFCPVGSARGTPCPAGYYCPPGAAAATPCPPGFYCPAGSAAANLSCPVGSYCPPMSPAPPPVLGVAPTASSSQAAAAVVLLPLLTAPQASALVNVTVAGTALCAGATPRLTAMEVGGVPCAAVACPSGSGSGSLATCVGWNASAAAAGMAGTAGIQVQLNASATWAAVSPPQSLRCEACVPAFIRPSVASVIPPTIAAVGVPVVVTGIGFMDASATPPAVLVGGVACGNVVVLFPQAVQCTAPTVPVSASGYPVVSVVVTNAAGAASTEVVTITYPATFAATWTAASPAVALPGATLAPSPVLSVLSREAATCTLTINASACVSADASLLARPVGMAVQASATTLLTVGSSGSLVPSSTVLTLDGLAVSGASGCAGTLMASCIDVTGNTATTAGQPGPAVALAAWGAAWNHTLPSPLVLATEYIPTLNASFHLVDAGGGSVAAAAAGGYLNFSAAAGSFLSCVAVVLPAAAGAPASDTPLVRLPPRDVYSSVAGTLAGASTGATSAAIAFAGLIVGTAQLGQALEVYAECTWTPTGERVRLPPMHTSTLSLDMSWEAPPRVVLGYTLFALALAATLAAPASGAPSAVAAACEFRLLNATVRSASLVSDGWTLLLDPRAPAGARVATGQNVTLQAPPGTVAFVQAACGVLGQALLSPPIRIDTAALELRALSPLPTSFVASDASSPWPLDPPLTFAVVAATSEAVVTDVTCSVTTSSAGATLAIVGADSSSASLMAVPAHPVTGVVAMPPFVVQTSHSTPSVALSVECRRTTGSDAPSPLTFVVPAVQLRARLCDAPQTHSAVSTPLAPFSVGIVTSTGGVASDPCVPLPQSSLIPLPPIVCTITLNASATTTNDTANIFLQRTVAIMAPTTHRAAFGAFTLVAPQGQSYGLTLTCTVGGLTIPSPLEFAVVLAGCAVGQESVSVACVVCGGGMFSLGGMGARCRGCPRAGATCNAGILSLQPHYFLPASQAGEPIGPDTELHSCFNAEACTMTAAVNGSASTYGCGSGYTGPLCGVCDAGANYARFGEACATCWNPGASWTFMLVLLAAVGAVLTRVALRTETSRSDASIVLRITLSYLQAVGSLRVFRAGSTQAYSNVMGWTEVVSASPLSVGALHCILRLPYLVQYIATVVLPVFAAAAVIVIYFAVTTGRAVRCTPRPSLDTAQLVFTVRTWLASKRHLSTLLFVLFLAYMPIISASLRALDCMAPIAGVRYLRSDLSVECGVGQHAAARAIAYIVLVVIGVGFPAGLIWLLGTARREHLLDPKFHSTWGFLFDGYRVPVLVRMVDAPSASELGKVTPAEDAAPAATAVASTPSGTASDGKGSGGGRRLAAQVSRRLVHGVHAIGDSRVWWEGIVLARKAGVVLLAVLVTNPYMQCVGATLWFAGFGALQARYVPYTNPLFNRLEMASLVVTFLTAVVSTALLQYNVGVAAADAHPPDAMTPIEWAVTIVLVLLNLGTFVALGGMWLRLQCHRATIIVRRSSAVSAAGARLAAARASIIARRNSGTAPRLPPGSPAASIVNPMHALGGGALPAVPAKLQPAMPPMRGRRHSTANAVIPAEFIPSPVRDS